MAYTVANQDLARFFDDLVRSETRLYNGLSDRMQAEHGIGLTQFELLRHLHSHAATRVADIAEYFAAGVGAISKGIDRLEKRGWVARHPNPLDRRSSLVALTDDGTALVGEAEATFQAGLADLIPAALTPLRLRSTTTALSTLRNALEDRQVGRPVG